MFPVSFFLFLISLLTIFKAPAKPLWYVALGATEWGHFLAIGSMVLAVAAWRQANRWGAASWMAVLAAFLFLTPLTRALLVARSLPQQLNDQFGMITPREETGAPSRVSPLSLMDLFRGIHSPRIQITTVVYATVNGQDLSLDLYRPIRIDQSMPGVIIIHGGSWQSGDRAEFPDLDQYLAARGYMVASLDYCLAPAAIFPSQRENVLAAIAYLKEHARDIGLDRDHLVLLGRSAGGQIALSAAYAQQDPAIKGVIALYAPNDLVWGYANPANPLIMDSRQVIETYLGGPPAKVPGTFDAASPLHFVNARTPPTLMIHGARDELVSPRHEDRLSERLAAAHRPYLYVRLPWATHGCDANFSGPSGQLSTYAIERFLASVLRR